MTASSGEAVLLCFKGMDQVRFFGSDTAGYCSVNNVRTLYDGARIQLTVGSDVDRTGRIYCEDPIPPDVVTDRPAEDAAAWILQNS
jgi:C-terminal processing protease CtpA/Prc